MEDKKMCSACKTEKPINEFYEQIDRKNGSSKCKRCHNDYCMDRWKQRKIDAINYKDGKCLDCEISHPNYPSAIFEFHHLDPKKKDTSWGKLRLRSWDKIINELDKCVMLCANCHRIRHNDY